jgi:hypothetical protein
VSADTPPRPSTRTPPRGSSALRAQALEARVPPTTLREFVRKSPFVVTAAREVRLVGLGAHPASARLAA